MDSILPIKGWFLFFAIASALLVICHLNDRYQAIAQVHTIDSFRQHAFIVERITKAVPTSTHVSTYLKNVTDEGYYVTADGKAISFSRVEGGAEGNLPVGTKLDVIVPRTKDLYRLARVHLPQPGDKP